MYFTQEDYNKVELWLSNKAVKDSSLPEATTPLSGEEIIAVTLDGVTKQTAVSNITGSEASDTVMNLVAASALVDLDSRVNNIVIPEGTTDTNIKTLELGTLYAGTVNTSTSNLTANSSYVITKSVTVLPYRGVTLNFKLPTYVKAVVFYNTGTTLMDSSKNSFTNNTASSSIANGGTWTAPTNHKNGFDSDFYRIRFEFTSSTSSTISISAIQTLIDNGDIKITYDATNETSVVLRNQDMLATVASATHYFTNDGSTEAEYQRGSGNMPTFVHGSDFHGDACRMNNLLEFADYIKADAALLTGDFVPTTGYEKADWVWDIMSKHTTVAIPCVGNHDTWNYTNGDLADAFFTKANAKYGYTGYSANNCYYYKDFSDSKIRVITLNQWYNTTYSWSSGTYNTRFGETQLKWFVSTLASTPTGYGVLVVVHALGDFTTPYTWNTYSDNFYDSLVDSATAGDIKIGATFAGIAEIIDTFIEKDDLVLSVSDLDGTYSIPCEFTSVPDSVEFIAYCTGHLHRDLVGYLKDTTNKLLVLNVGVDNSSNNYNIDFGKGGGRGKALDLFNVYGIDRVNKAVRVVRIGNNTTHKMSQRRAMIIPYAE